MGIYAHYTSGELSALQNSLLGFVGQYPHILQSHGFFYFAETHTITLDIIPDHTIHDDEAFHRQFVTAITKQFPDYNFNIVMDHLYSE